MITPVFAVTETPFSPDMMAARGSEVTSALYADIIIAAAMSVAVAYMPLRLPLLPMICCRISAFERR